jgi:murein DD-endopeptidase MepM/ murein hydrolase activator NlpD
MVIGTPIFAARAGVIWTSGFGYIAVQVDSAVPPTRDWYLHINDSVITVGHVNEGELIAHSGAKQVPGGPPITGPHLHFEVQTGQLDIYATSLNPIPVLLGENDMTPYEHAVLVNMALQLDAFLTNKHDYIDSQGDAVHLPVTLTDLIADIKAGSSGLTVAQDLTLTDTHTIVGRIEGAMKNA